MILRFRPTPLSDCVTDIYCLLEVAGGSDINIQEEAGRNLASRLIIVLCRLPARRLGLTPSSSSLSSTTTSVSSAFKKKLDIITPH